MRGASRRTRRSLEPIAQRQPRLLVRHALDEYDFAADIIESVECAIEALRVQHGVGGHPDPRLGARHLDADDHRADAPAGGSKALQLRCNAAQVGG